MNIKNDYGLLGGFQMRNVNRSLSFCFLWPTMPISVNQLLSVFFLPISYKRASSPTKCVFIFCRLNRMRLFPHMLCAQEADNFCILSVHFVLTVELFHIRKWCLKAGCFSVFVKGKINTVRISECASCTFPWRLSGMPYMKNDCGAKWAVRYQLWSWLCSELMWRAS